MLDSPPACLRLLYVVIQKALFLLPGYLTELEALGLFPGEGEERQPGGHLAYLDPLSQVFTRASNCRHL